MWLAQNSYGPHATPAFFLNEPEFSVNYFKVVIEVIFLLEAAKLATWIWRSQTEFWWAWLMGFEDITKWLMLIKKIADTSHMFNIYF